MVNLGEIIHSLLLRSYLQVSLLLCCLHHFPCVLSLRLLQAQLLLRSMQWGSLTVRTWCDTELLKSQQVHSTTFMWTQGLVRSNGQPMLGQPQEVFGE